MKRFFGTLVLALLVPLAPALAQGNNQVFRWTRYTVGTQQIQLYQAGHVRPDCEPMGEIRMVIPMAPQNGTLQAIPGMGFVDFGNEEPYKKCSLRRTTVLSVVYNAKEGYKGTDKFSFLLVYSDGASRRYDVEMTVY